MDDMLDGENIQDLEEPLGLVISYIHASLYETYSEFDRHAIANHWYHRVFSFLAVFFGTLAIILSILLVFIMAYEEHVALLNIPNLAMFEKGALLTALLSILIALVNRLLRDWLVKQYMAEQCRTLKFRSLIHPFLSFSSDSAWTERFTQWKTRFDDKVALLKKKEDNTLEEILVIDKIGTPPHDTSCNPPNVPYLATLVNYYQEKRIRTQIDYFSARAREFRTANKYTERIPQYYFIAGVLCSGIQLGIELFTPWFLAYTPETNLTVVSVGILLVNLSLCIIHGLVSVGIIIGIGLVNLLLLALTSSTTLDGLQSAAILLTLVLPSIGVAFRTWRSSEEVSRNASLFRAKCRALRLFEMRLAEERSKEIVNWEKILKIMWECENFFESENKEWLRIMHDAEWFL